MASFVGSGCLRGGAGLNQKVRRKALIKLKYKKLGKNICQKMNRRRGCERWLGMKSKELLYKEKK